MMSRRTITAAIVSGACGFVWVVLGPNARAENSLVAFFSSIQIGSSLVFLEASLFSPSLSNGSPLFFWSCLDSELASFPDLASKLRAVKCYTYRSLPHDAIRGPWKRNEIRMSRVHLVGHHEQLLGE